METEIRNVCDGCDGSGEVFIRAEQQGGEISDEQVRLCTICKGWGEVDY